MKESTSSHQRPAYRPGSHPKAIAPRRFPCGSCGSVLSSRAAYHVHCLSHQAELALYRWEQLNRRIGQPILSNTDFHQLYLATHPELHSARHKAALLSGKTDTEPEQPKANAYSDMRQGMAEMHQLVDMHQRSFVQSGHAMGNEVSGKPDTCPGQERAEPCLLQAEAITA